MDCKQQLSQQLEDLEKNRGVLNIMKTSLKTNPLFKFIASLVIAHQPKDVPPSTEENLVSKIELHAGNAIGLTQTLLASYLTLPGNTADLYYYYLLKNQLIPWLEKRRTLVKRILDHLYQVRSLAEQNFYFRLSPSAVKEYQTLVMFLDGAKNSLLQIPYIEVTVRNERGEVIKRGYEIPGSVPTKLTDFADLKTLKNTPVFYFTMRAFSLLESAQGFLRNTLQMKPLSNYEKKLQERLKLFLEQNNTILSDLASSIPIPLAEILTSLDFVKKTVKEPLGKVAKKSLGMGGDDTLVLLNGRIILAKSMFKSFDRLFAKFTGDVSQSVQREMASFQNIELNKLISDIKGEQYPLTLFDFYLKAPSWYARIEVIKYSLFYINLEELTPSKYGLSDLYQTQNILMQDLLKAPDQGKLFEKVLINSFPEIVKILYIGNFFAAERKTFSLDYLIELGNNTLAQDLAYIQGIKRMTPPNGYALFEKMLNRGMNVLQSSSVLGPATSIVTEGIKTGLFLAIPSMVGKNTQGAITSTLSTISGLPAIIPGIQESSAFLDYLDGSNDFEECESLKGKNLFLNPNYNNPTGEEIVDGITDAYKELWTSIDGRIEE